MNSVDYRKMDSAFTNIYPLTNVSRSSYDKKSF